MLDYAIIRLDPEGTIQTWNLGAERVKGYTAEEAIGHNFAMFYPEGDRRSGLPQKLLAEAAETGRVEHEGWRLRKDGSRFWGDVNITALHDDAGNLTGFTKVTRDLTERHELEVTLRASEERLRLLVGQVVDYAIIGLDPQGVIESWNLGAERLKGYTAEEAIGRSFAMFYPEETGRRDSRWSCSASPAETGRVEHTGWRLRKDGSRFWGDVVITALHDDAGNAHRIHQGDPRPDRPEVTRGCAGRVLRGVQPRLPHTDHRPEGLRRRHPRCRWTTTSAST